MARVLLVYQPIDGGVGRHVSDLSAGLASVGHEVLTCGPAPLGGTPTSQRHAPLQLRRAVSPRTDARALRAFGSILRAVRPDIVHAHSSKAGAVARLARTAHRVPVIYTPHGYAFAGFFEREPERIAYRSVERLLSPLASRVVCVCEAEAALARSVGPAERVRVVYNGVQPAGCGEIDPAMARLRADGPLIATVTQLRPGKGLETLIDATPRLLGRQPRAQIAIWGDGPEQDALRSRSQSLGVAHAVHFLGATTDPLSVLRGADLFVLPSWAEAFPYVMLEAMSVARPIVASDVGGLREGLGDGDVGRLVPVREPHALADALGDLLGDSVRSAALGDAARRRVEQRFTVANMVQGVAHVYQEVLDR
jgi:glycosyltransferase involved in cell wall biosynthesis